HRRQLGAVPPHHQGHEHDQLQPGLRLLPASAPARSQAAGAGLLRRALQGLPRHEGVAASLRSSQPLTARLEPSQAWRRTSGAMPLPTSARFAGYAVALSLTAAACGTAIATLPDRDHPAASASTPTVRVPSGYRRRRKRVVLTGIHKIRHVIVIMQENRSFDS